MQSKLGKKGVELKKKKGIYERNSCHSMHQLVRPLSYKRFVAGKVI